VAAVARAVPLCGPFGVLRDRAAGGFYKVITGLPCVSERSADLVDKFVGGFVHETVNIMKSLPLLVDDQESGSG
jgi:hypothetical protein